MKKTKKLIKYILAILILVMFLISIWGIPLKKANISVKGYGTTVSGTFTGTWSPIKGKNGTFTADEGWTFEGIINPDGELFEGKLTNFPIPSEWRESSMFDLPAFYTGTVEECILTDVTLK